MKKKLLFIGSIICIASILYITNFNSQNPNLYQQNVEALAAGESDCNYSNGYRKFSGTKGGGYDCCIIWRQGDGMEDCY